jgi:molybdopterin converting factor small subunit
MRDAGSLDELVGQIVAAHGEKLERVLTACSFLVDGTSTRDRALQLSPGAVVDVLPPFAGG